MDFDGIALVTHKNCMDGATCSIMFQAVGGDPKKIYYSSPNHRDVDELVRPLIDENRMVLLADISISSKFAEEINSKYCSSSPPIYVIDHHKSAIGLSRYPWCEIELENQRAGGRMLYDFFCQRGFKSKLKPYEDLVLAADDHDRWIKNIPESKQIAALFSATDQELFIERFLDDPSLELTETEKYLLMLEERKKQKFISDKKKHAVVLNKRFNDTGTLRVAYVIANSHQSDLGHSIYEDQEMNVDIVVMLGSGTVSMRSRKSCPVDLSVIAKAYGGGGHAQAAGFSLSGLLETDLLEMVSKKLDFNVG